MNHPPSMPAGDTRRLADLVGAKHACLLGLRELALRQQELIAAGDMTPLLTVLAEKQRALGELQELERQLDPFRSEDPALRTWSGEAERLRCASLAEQASKLMAEILDVEKRCEESLRRRRDETAEQLAVVQASGQARGAYAAAETNSVPASTLDLTSET